MVLDPFSTFSLAGNIVKFVDFTSKVLSKSHEIYRSSSGGQCKDRKATLTMGIYMDVCHDQSLRLIIQRLFGLFGLVG